MKRLVSLCLVAVVSLMATGAFAAPKPNDSIVTTVFIADIDCESCSKKIMSSIPYQKGVKDVRVDVPKKIVTVSYDAKKSSDEQIITSLGKLKIKAHVAKP